MSDSVLAHRYRRVLRLLPASYRAVWEEDMVATFLEGVHTDDPEEAAHLADCGRPSRAERASVAALAVRLRLGGVESPPRSFAWGEAVRRVALTVLLVNAVVASIGVWQELWIAGWFPWPPVPGGVLAVADVPLSSPVDVAWSLAPLLWVAAYLALVLGGRRVARVLAGLALVPAVVAGVLSAVGATTAMGAPVTSVLTAWADLVVSALLVLALAAFHRDAPPVRPRPWLRAYVAGLALAALPGALFLVQAVGDIVLLDWPGVWSVAVAVAGVVYLTGPAAKRAPRAPAWALALALLAGGVLALRVVSVLDYALAGAARSDPVLLTLGVVEGVAVVGVGVPLAVLAARALGGLPPAAHDPAAARAAAP